MREQLHLISPGEYDKVNLGARMPATGKVIVPASPDANRIQRVTLTSPKFHEAMRTIRLI